MSRPISRSDFAHDMTLNKGEGDGAINVNDMDPTLRAALNRAGVSDEQLTRIAGKDGQISGQAEFGRLFDKLDRLDDDGSRNSIERGSEAAPTLAGEAMTELENELTRRRMAADNQGVIHLGMRKESAAEAEALRSVTPGHKGGVHEVKAYAADDKVSLPDGRTFDLKTDAGRDAFVKTFGLSTADEAKFKTLLATAKDGTRDELANLGQALADVGTGKLDANRLVLSGHGDGTRLFDDGSGELAHASLRTLGELFPEGAGKIKHIAFSSCFSGSNAKEWQDLKQAFPNLKSITGYAEFSPSAEKGAPADLRAWALRTDGDDPSRVDPTGRNMATWNVKDGNQNMPSLTPAECAAIKHRAEALLERYKERGNYAAGSHDPTVRAVYIQLAQACNAPGLDDDLRRSLRLLKDEMYDVRHGQAPFEVLPL